MISRFLRSFASATAFAFVLFATASAFAAPSRSTAQTPNLAGSAPVNAAISEGDLAVSADSGLTIILPDKGDSTVDFGISTEYFIKDALSAGGSLEVANTPAFNRFLLGPSASYYFWRKDRMVVGGHAGLFLVNETPKNLDSYSYFNLRFGASGNYFITRNLAFGPDAQMRFFFGSDKLGRNFEFALLGRFSLFF